MQTKVLLGITQSNQGGAQRYVYDLARSLSPERYAVTVVSGSEGPLQERLKKIGIRSIPLPSLQRSISIGNDLRTLITLYRLLRSERPDVFHTNSSKMGVLGALAGRAAGVPCIVFTAHGWAFQAPKLSKIKRAFYYILSITAVALSHVTIAVSEAVVSDLPHILRARVVVIYNGVDEMLLRPRDEARQQICSQYPTLPTDGFWFGTVAELLPVKGHVTAINAFADLVDEYPDARYLIAGDGPERESLEKLVQEKDLEGRVIFLGFVPANEIFKALDTFILPSSFEGLGYVLLEASVAEIPIVASHTGGIPEVLNDNVSALLVPVGDVKALTMALRRIISNTPLRLDLARAALSQVRDKFSLHTMVEATIRAYKQ